MMAKPPIESPREPARIGKAEVALPRIEIAFCTQCKWMLRAAYVSLKNSFESQIVFICYLMKPVPGVARHYAAASLIYKMLV